LQPRQPTPIDPIPLLHTPNLQHETVSPSSHQLDHSMKHCIVLVVPRKTPHHSQLDAKAPQIMKHNRYEISLQHHETRMQISTAPLTYQKATPQRKFLRQTYRGPCIEVNHIPKPITIKTSYLLPQNSTPSELSTPAFPRIFHHINATPSLSITYLNNYLFKTQCPTISNKAWIRPTYSASPHTPLTTYTDKTQPMQSPPR